MAGQNLVTGKSTNGGTVTVYNYGTLIKPTINKSDSGVAANNPITAAADGSYAFWVNDGHYNVVNGTPTGNLELRLKQSTQPTGYPSAKEIQTTPFLNSASTNLEAWKEIVDQTVYPDATLVLNKATLKGIKVDLDAPTYPWKDMIGEISLKQGGATIPTLSVWQGNIYAISFEHATAVQEAFNDFHLPHDYVMASDMYIHTHWSTKVTATGDCNWLFDLSYGKGYAQGIIEGTAGTSLPVTVGVVTTGGAAFTHFISEVKCSTPGGLVAETINVSITSGAATLTAASALFSAADIGKTVQIVGAGAAGAVLNTTISAYASATSVTVADNAGTTVTTQPNFRWRVLDSSLFEPDGMIFVRTWHQANRAADTLNQVPFLHFVDMHYQSTGIGTKARTGPTFWT